jgi:hypothetical protein
MEVSDQLYASTALSPGEWAPRYWLNMSLGGYQNRSRRCAPAASLDPIFQLLQYICDGTRSLSQIPAIVWLKLRS